MVIYFQTTNQWIAKQQAYHTLYKNDLSNIISKLNEVAVTGNVINADTGILWIILFS